MLTRIVEAIARCRARRWQAVCLVSLGLVAAGVIDAALAETQPQSGVPAGETKSHIVKGFRDASFGMTEQEVVAAVKKDFKLSDQQISYETNLNERTRSVVIKVNNLIPDAGTTLIAYVFGATSKRLMQINLVWGQPVVEKPDLQGLVSAANSLRNLFLGQGYAPNSVVANGRLPDGTLLVFRGLDAEGHMTLLLLALPQSVADPPASSDQAAKPKPDPAKADSPATLRLSYIEKPDKPDIFKLDGGF